MWWPVWNLPLRGTLSSPALRRDWIGRPLLRQPAAPIRGIRDVIPAEGIVPSTAKRPPTFTHQQEGLSDMTTIKQSVCWGVVASAGEPADVAKKVKEIGY